MHDAEYGEDPPMTALLEEPLDTVTTVPNNKLKKQNVQN